MPRRFLILRKIRIRWISWSVSLFTLGLTAVAILSARHTLTGISVTVLKASSSWNGESDLELEIANTSGVEVLIPAYTLPGESPELWMSESPQPIDAGRRHQLEVWIHRVQSSPETAGDQPLSVTRCQPTDLATSWDSPLRLPASGPRHSLHARLHILGSASVLGIAYAPLQKPGMARIWIRYQLTRWGIRTPDWLTGSRVQFLELHPPWTAGRVFGAQGQN